MKVGNALINVDENVWFVDGLVKVVATVVLDVPVVDAVENGRIDEGLSQVSHAGIYIKSSMHLHV